METSFDINEALDWKLLRGQTLRQALINQAKEDLGVESVRGEMTISVDGDQFCAVFVKEPSPKVNAIIIESNGNMYLQKVGELEELQKLVGGYIEGITLGDTGQFFYVNEDGIEMGLPRNDVATKLCSDHKVGLSFDDFIKGTMVIVGPSDGNGENTDVSPILIQELGL